MMVALLRDLKAEVIFLPRSAKTIFAVQSAANLQQGNLDLTGCKDLKRRTDFSSFQLKSQNKTWVMILKGLKGCV